MTGVLLCVNMRSDLLFVLPRMEFTFHTAVYRITEDLHRPGHRLIIIDDQDLGRKASEKHGYIIQTENTRPFDDESRIWRAEDSTKALSDYLKKKLGRNITDDIRVYIEHCENNPFGNKTTVLNERCLVSLKQLLSERHRRNFKKLRRTLCVVAKDKIKTFGQFGYYGYSVDINVYDNYNELQQDKNFESYKSNAMIMSGNCVAAMDRKLHDHPDLVEKALSSLFVVPNACIKNFSDYDPFTSKWPTTSATSGGPYPYVIGDKHVPAPNAMGMHAIETAKLVDAPTNRSSNTIEFEKEIYAIPKECNISFEKTIEFVLPQCLIPLINRGKEAEQKPIPEPKEVAPVPESRMKPTYEYTSAETDVEVIPEPKEVAPVPESRMKPATEHVLPVPASRTAISKGNSAHRYSLSVVPYIILGIGSLFFL